MAFLTGDVRSTLEWFVPSVLEIQHEMDIVIGRVSEWDHHGYYRLNMKPAMDMFNGDLVYEICLYHDYYHPDIRGFNSSHVMMFTRMSLVHGCTKHCLDFICMRISFAMSTDQLVNIIPCSYVHRYKHWNVLGQRTWTILDLQPVSLHEFKWPTPWIRSFDKLFQSFRAKFSYYVYNGLCFDIHFKTLPMPYLRFSVLPHSMDLVNDDMSLGETASVEFEITGSYYPQDEWFTRLPKERSAFCFQRALFNDHGEVLVSHVMNLQDTQDTWKWLMAHFITKMTYTHVENLLFNEPMKYIYPAYELLDDKTTDIPNVICGSSLMNCGCQPLLTEQMKFAAFKSVMDDRTF